MSIRNFFFNVTDFGASGNGTTDDTGAITGAIRACRDSGGTVYFPPGIYLTASLHLVSNLALYLDPGARLLFVCDFDRYPPVRTRWEGVECFGFSPLVYGNDLKNVTIKGHGMLDGQGGPWWRELHRKRSAGVTGPESAAEKKLASLNTGFEQSGSGGGGREMQFLRPPLLQLLNCRNVTIDGITLQNSPFWNTHLVYCDDVTIRDVTFRNPPLAPNTDGLDLDSCTNVRISGCHFDVGDDCLCLKSGIDEDGRRVGRPTENITVTNCTMLHGHGGVVFGSEAAAGIRNVVISNCIFDGTDRGIRMKSRRGRGGGVENVQVSNIIMRDTLCPFVMNLFYKCGAAADDRELFGPDPRPVSEKTPIVRNLAISNITASNVKAAAAFFYGLPEQPVENIRLSGMMIEMDTGPENKGGQPGMVHNLPDMIAEGFYCRYVKGLILDQVRLVTNREQGLHADDCSDVDSSGLQVMQPV